MCRISFGDEKRNKTKSVRKSGSSPEGGVGRQISTPTYSWDQKNANKILFQIKIEEAMMTQERATSNDSIAHCPVISDSDWYDNIKLYNTTIIETTNKRPNKTEQEAITV